MFTPLKSFFLLLLHFRFDFDNESSTSIKIKCIIVQRTLEVVDITDNKSVINRLSFKNIYYGDTDIYRVILFNNSPVNSNYLISVNPKKSHSITVGGSLALTIRKGILEKTSDLENMFEISPNQVNMCCVSITNLYNMQLFHHSW